MADDSGDPREVAWHPRYGAQLLGHTHAEDRMLKAWQSGIMHHAWLIAGQQGIGKASLAYRLAGSILASSGSHGRTAEWIAARAHPDLFVLARNWDAKTKKLKTEISVDDCHRLADFFSLTAAGGGWRVAIIDAADDLNIASANALLKLMEEPPKQALILIVCNRPGRLLPTFRSRCLRLDLQPLSTDETREVLNALPLDEKPTAEVVEVAVGLANGSPGRAVELLASAGARIFSEFQKSPAFAPEKIVTFANRFSTKSCSADDYGVFCNLLENWVATKARSQALDSGTAPMAGAYAAIGHSLRQANALNLDRRQTVVQALALIEEALKPA